MLAQEQEGLTRAARRGRLATRRLLQKARLGAVEEVQTGEAPARLQPQPRIAVAGDLERHRVGTGDADARQVTAHERGSELREEPVQSHRIQGMRSRLSPG